jgi:outer membrane protein assembly factor BamB
MSGRSSPVGARARTCGRPNLAGLAASTGYLLAFVVLGLAPREAAAQVAVSVDAKTAPNGAVDRGFSIVYDDRLSESLAKFDGFVQAKTWERAFLILSDIPEDKWSSMLPDRNGFIRPASQRVRQTILDLPAAGREAYRVYFDAKARRLFESLRTATKEDDVKIARTIYDRYFITSVGDDAADRLAEDYFEHGQFVEAAACWKSIFEFHPDTNLSEPKILLKRAVALYRAGLDGEFRIARQQLQQGFPGTRLVVGGQEVVADDYLKGLESEEKPSRPARETTSADSSFSGLAPADGAAASWQFRFLQEKDLAAIEETMRNWYGAPALTTVLPAAVTDGERVYANWLGATFAIDLASGKTAWSSEPNVKTVVSQLRSNNGRSMLFTTNAGQFALCLGQEGPGKGIVLSVSASPNQSNRFHLVARNAAAGNLMWTTDQSNSDLGHASFIGTPLIDGNSVFALSHEVAAENPQGRIRNNGVTAGQMVLRRLDLQTGTELWPPLPLGTPQFVGDPDWGQQSLPIPSLVMSGGRLYVLTNDGALLAVNVGRHQIEWAYKYEPPASSGNRQRFFNPTSATGRHLRSTGPIVVRDGVVYFKESTSPTLYALEESGPHLRWKWQDSEFANLIGVDNSDVYLFSNELSAINRTQPETRWSNRLTVDLQGVGAQIGSRGVLVFTPRGLFELSKETGDVRRIFRGADLGAAGGFVLAAGKQIVCVSNLAVTAYPAATDK